MLNRLTKYFWINVGFLVNMQISMCACFAWRYFLKDRMHFMHLGMQHVAVKIDKGTFNFPQSCNYAQPESSLRFYHQFELGEKCEFLLKWWCHKINASSEALKHLVIRRNSQRKYANLGRLRKFGMSTRGISSPPRVFTYFGGNLIFKAKTLSLLWNLKLRVDIWGN